MFLTVFHSFSPFLCPRANHSCRSLLLLLFCKERGEQIALVDLYISATLIKSLPLAHYKRATLSDLLRLLFTKEADRSIRSFHKQIALLLFRSQKRSDSLENQRANSQPWVLCDKKVYFFKFFIFSLEDTPQLYCTVHTVHYSRMALL